ncbi:MAG: hypothetical protein A3F84_20295 [Candidatus Handelsmanbacteria bacterium RIFCSPLOWO2_12_FULL_64_10]|uniref:Uncharacterized protein n=1 Tax=Handelsmanbacteria sp. (strain RIFCSPLOWO2_12_FULL_64_10) TaxID=1817868 RepID=A0A1F6CBY7_HANXR|nr:MAG: hypothetical protein A3F84_20295 [Candidatus Handelsmanbacteria bacterium RIFCSPLOWO2_12_FULL_64_10]
METFWERVKGGLFEGAMTVAERAEHLSYVGRMRLDIANDKRLMQSAFAELGRRVYRLLSEGAAEEVPKDGAVLDLLRRIRQREETLREREAALVSLMKAGKAGENPKSSEK